MSTALLVGSHLFNPSLKLFRNRAMQTEPDDEPINGTKISGIPLICFCHLRWDGVWQRPQQLLSRLAHHHPVVFVETHCSDVPASASSHRQPAGHPHVTVLEMHLPASRWDDGDFIDQERRR